MKVPEIVVVESEILSDGKIELRMFRRRWSVARYYNSGEIPDIHHDLLKKDAYDIYTEYVMNDVMDLI
jgi:hypothetical protein